MPKHIFLLSDGTGNAASSPHKTNVWRFYKALDLQPVENDHLQQLAFYDDGVGVSSFLPLRLLGLAFGWGLKKNVLDLYLNLCRVYEPGDKVSIFGFSRGAFTARVLAALICSQGILKNNQGEDALRAKVKKAYADFRQVAFGVAVLYFPLWAYRQFRSIIESDKADDRYLPQENGPPLIDVLGVWDTVDAYGSPLDEMTRAWDRVVWPLSAKDRNLGDCIGYAYHALALDEKRESFNPMLWNERADETGQNKEGQGEREQVWFAGVHANVGGGYPDDSLAHISLNWMIKKCQTKGIRFNQQVVQSYHHAQDAFGKIYNNRSGFGVMYRYAPRKVEELCNNKNHSFLSLLSRKSSRLETIDDKVRIDCPKIHQSVFHRIRHGSDAYAPIGLPEHYCVVDDEGNETFPPDVFDDDPAINAFETKKLAENRRSQQGALWVSVWTGRLLYFLMVLFVGFYVLYPFAAEKSELTGRIDSTIGGMAEIVHVIPKTIGQIPGLGLIDGWATRYQDFPYMFLGGFLIIVLALLAGSKISRSIKDNMRQNWRHVFSSADEDPGEPKHRSHLEWFFDGRLKRSETGSGRGSELVFSKLDWAQWGVRGIAEWLFVVVFAITICFGLWRVTYAISDGTGGVCQVQKPEIKLSKDSPLASIPFDPTNPCLDTGIQLSKDQFYDITFEIEHPAYKGVAVTSCKKDDEKKLPHPWCDASIKADARGFIDGTPLLHWAMSGLKRHLAKAWYEPIVKIDSEGFYRESFQPVASSEGENSNGVWKSTLQLKVEQSGRLFVYLNDAVAPPIFRDFFAGMKRCATNKGQGLLGSSNQNGDRWVFYKNNCGKANITVTKIKPSS